MAEAAACFARGRRGRTALTGERDPARRRRVPRCSSSSPASCRAWCSTSGFDDRAAGYVASAEMFGIAATTVAMTFAAQRFNWRGSCMARSLIDGRRPTSLCTLVTRRRRRSPPCGSSAGSRRRRADLALVRGHRSHSQPGPQFRLPDHVGADVRRLRPAADADGLSRLRGSTGVLWFFALFPLITLPWLRYFPVSGENTAQVEKDAVDLRGLGEGLRARGDVRCTSSPRAWSGPTCS